MLLWVLGTHKHKQPALLEAVAQELLQPGRLQQLSGYQLGVVLWSLAHLVRSSGQALYSMAPLKVFQRCTPLLQPACQDMNSLSLALVVWGLATMQMNPGGLLAGLRWAGPP